ncbi:MAG: CPBP family intramembrane metalloprotease, partial [Bacillota bacterium]|nr:CPBP family intramembrane metalloprotease [Bacillota bacterium]
LEKQIYNFDHHEGCIRPFTLSTCEQVLVMILKGMDLRGRDWRVFANEPDLDTILAIWLIFNHVRIQQKEFGGLNRLCSLVRLEGIIDSHGLEMTALSGLPPKPLLNIKKMMDYLRAEEVDLKTKGIWKEMDFLEYTALILHKVDQIIYKSEELGDVKDVKELARVEIGNSRIAVVVETQVGIYELEPYLNRLYGESLGLVILKKEEGTYTLRRWDPFMPGDLNAVYEILNFIDPAVRGRADGNKWGGSADIGGSPRESGTKLTPKEIAKSCREAFQKPGLGTNVIRFIRSVIITSATIGISTLCASYLFPRSWLSSTATQDLFTKTDFLFFTALIFFTALCLAFLAHRRPWQFGIAVPIGKNWWILLPFVLFSVFGLGIYFPYKGMKLHSIYETAIYLIIAVPLASELLFRSLIHGILVNPSNIQSCRSRWFLSFPSVAAALLYSGFMVYLLLFSGHLQNGFQAKATAGCLFAAFVLGLSTSFVRERSQSVFPAIIFHALGMIALIKY